jgi:hypothetical protein
MDACCSVGGFQHLGRDVDVSSAGVRKGVHWNELSEGENAVALEPALIKIAEVLAPQAIRYVGPTVLGYLGVSLARDASESFSGLSGWAVAAAGWAGWAGTVLAGVLIVRQVLLDALGTRRR